MDGQGALFGGAIALAAWLLLWLTLRRKTPDVPSMSAGIAGAGPSQPTGHPPGVSRPPSSTAGPRPATLDEVYAAALAMREVFESAARPADLLGHPVFEQAVYVAGNSSMSDAELLSLYSGDHLFVAICAAEALARRRPGPGIRATILHFINDLHPYTRFFALRALSATTPAGGPVLVQLLAALNETWRDRMLRNILPGFVLERLEAGDPIPIEEIGPRLTDASAKLLEELLGPIDHETVRKFVQDLDHWRAVRVDRSFLQAVGVLWDAADAEPAIDHPAFAACRAQFEASLLGASPRSVLLVGERGTGRTALLRDAWLALARRGYSIFEAGHMELLAGQVYVGQVEERIQRLVRELDASRRIIWYVPDFQSLLHTGRHWQSPTGALDLLFPALAEGRILIVGETEPVGFDSVVQGKPAVLSLFDVIRFDPLPEPATLEVATRWARREAEESGFPEMSDRILREASRLSEQYMGDRAGPGRLLEFLKGVLRGRESLRHEPLTLEDLLETLSRSTGLPLRILDDRERLDLDQVRSYFSERVLGQPEAVDVLLDRLAMVKAGVTDPTRPLGVFLFAGPTGTGKTEMAKTLAEYLFGSPERMIRIDMSELQFPESVGRLVGDSRQENNRAALVDRIRQRPFSVILLDEFEKAHPAVWDLFLQVFDDGRLTDWTGKTADFRNAVIILTSNLGGAIGRGASLGFAEGEKRFSASAVERAVGQAFRKELINRIDRTVVFEPLTREVLRDILQKELRDVFLRRGLRSRSWAVVWDESAVEFLLDRGFTRDLGARPLKRTVDRFVLAPLAATIVSREYPQGDQFLFVRSEGERLHVEFVDPDAPSAAPAAPAPAAAGVTSLEKIAFEPHGTVDEIACLEGHLALVEDAIRDDAWRARKQAGLGRTQAPHFWDSPERFAVLGTIELMDRIEGAVKSAAFLFQKLRGKPDSGRKRFVSDFVGRVAVQLLLLRTSLDDVREDRPSDAFLLLEGTAGDGAGRDAPRLFFGHLASMYRRWGEKRGMKSEVLADEELSREPRVLLAVSGFGAHTLLAPEAGLHVFEEPLPGGRTFARFQARVRVVPQPDTPSGRRSGGLRAQAQAAFAGAVPQALHIVRRYRREPSPLVRDAVRGWRTGKIERVFDGDFDLFATEGPLDAAELHRLDPGDAD